MKKKFSNEKQNKINTYVAQAKYTLDLIGSYQYKLAKMACEICDIRHGGISTHLYTVTDFANDIGMNSKTLQNWVSVYRTITKKCGISITTESDWKKARLAMQLIKHEKRRRNKSDGKTSKYRNELDASVIKNLFYGIGDEKPVQLKIDRILEAFRHSKFTLEQANVSEVNKDSMYEIRKLCSEVGMLIDEKFIE